MGITHPQAIQSPRVSGGAAGIGVDILDLAEALKFGDIHFKIDPAAGLQAIIAIHDTSLGPALGGCRLVSYPSTEAALLDAMRLARGMTYKAAISGLPLGGGKAVLMRPPNIEDREAYFEAFGSFVDELGGRYITAVDSGTSVADMDVIARCTKHVACTSASRAGTDDPSPHTALGVCRGIQAAVKSKLNRDDLDGVHVAMQGVGHVGYPLARLLRENGAQLTVCDMDEHVSQRCVDEFGATAVSPDHIYEIECDVFAPCALGAVINDHTVGRLKAGIVAGAANNQLAEERHGKALHERGILYAPDYVINAGGIIQIIVDDESDMRGKILNIYDTLTRIFAQSAKTNEAPHQVADSMVDAILAAQSTAQGLQGS